MGEGSIELALLAAFTFLGGLVFETRVLLRFRTHLYFAASLPLGLRLVPIPHAPKGAGRTASVRWEVAPDGWVRFWADPAERKAPSGLHGIVRMTRTAQGVRLDVRWAPPWSPAAAAAWLAVLGLVRGETLTVPIGLAIIVGLGVVYWDRARRVAAELRYSFVHGEESDPEL